MKKANRIIVPLIVAALLLALVPTGMIHVSASVTAVTLESTGNAKMDEFINDPRFTNGVSWGGKQVSKLKHIWKSCAAYCADYVYFCYGKTYPNQGTYFNDIYEIRAGDVIIIGNPSSGKGHWFVCLKREGDKLYTAEGNYGGKVRIGWYTSIKDNKHFTDRSYTFTKGYHWLPATPEFLDSCTPYPSYCTLRTTSKTYMKTHPYSEDSDPSSENVFPDGIASGTVLTATKLYKNKWGKYWYYCTYNGKSGYVLSDHTSFVEVKYDDLSKSDMFTPKDVYPVGCTITPTGTLTTTNNKISSVTISLTESNFVGPIPGENVDAYRFDIAGTASSKAIAKSSPNLSAGVYNYRVEARLTGNYIKNGNLEEYSEMVTAVSKRFAIDSDCPASSMSSTLTLSEPTIAADYVKVFASQTVSNGSLNATTQIGIRIYDASGKLLTTYSEKPSTMASTSTKRNINYTIGTKQEVNYTLAHNTTYKYVIYAVVDGVDYKSPTGTFTTLPAASSDLSSTITLGTPVITADYVKVTAKQTITNGSLSDLTQRGIRIYDEEGEILKSFIEKAAALSSYYLIGTGQEVDLTLEVGADYQYEIFAIVGGIEFCSERGTFRNTAGVTAEYTELYIADVTVNSAALAYRCDITGAKNSAVSRISFLLYDKENDYFMDEVFVEEPHLSGSNYFFYNTKNPDRFGSLAPETAYIVRVSSVISGVEFVSDPVEFTTLACEHVYGDWQVEGEATCAEYGQECRICSVCGISESRLIDKTPHTYDSNNAVKENELSPTCTLDGGYDSVVYCHECGEEVSRTHVVVYAAGHIWDSGVITVAPTTSETGVITYTCTICGETRTEVIPKLDRIKGDADGDGEVTVADALAALRVAAKLAPEAPEMIAVCDIDGDGEITVADALRILRVAAKLASPADLQ